MVSYLSGPYLGNAEAGFAARLLGLGPSVAAGGALCVLGSIAITWALLLEGSVNAVRINFDGVQYKRAKGQ